MPDGIGRQNRGGAAGDVDPDLCHRLDRHGIQVLGGLRSRRSHGDALAGDGRKVPRRHLGAPRVVHADEQDGVDAHAVRPIGMLPSICAAIVIVQLIATMTANTTVPIQTQSGGHPPATVRRRSTTVRPIM